MEEEEDTSSDSDVEMVPKKKSKKRKKKEEKKEKKEKKSEKKKISRKEENVQEFDTEVIEKIFKRNMVDDRIKLPKESMKLTGEFLRLMVEELIERSIKIARIEAKGSKNMDEIVLKQKHIYRCLGHLLMDFT